MTYTETRTQEDITELHAAHGLGCKSCEQPIAPGTACACEGDIYCYACGLQLAKVDAEVAMLPTRAQAAEQAAWDAQGVGTN